MNAHPKTSETTAGAWKRVRAAAFALAVLCVTHTAFAIGEVDIIHSGTDTLGPWRFAIDSYGRESFRAEASGLIGGDVAINWTLTLDGYQHPFQSHDDGRYITFDLSLDNPGSFSIHAVATNAEDPNDQAAATANADVVEVHAIAPIGLTEVGVNTTALTAADFNITTGPANNPEEHAMATWAGFPDMTTPGTYTVTATIGDSSASCQVTVSSGWIQVVSRPDLATGFKARFNTEDWTEIDPATGDVDYFQIWSSTHPSTERYETINQGNYSHNGSFGTQLATAKHTDIGVSGEISFKVYGVGTTVTASTTIGWQETTTHTLNTAGGDPDYQYYARHSQGVVDIKIQSIKRVKEDEDDTVWLVLDMQTKNVGVSGVKTFGKDKWKKSAGLPTGAPPVN